MTEQQPLFDLPQATPDIDETVARIKAGVDSRSPVEYEDRTSEAARDQGHGPQEWGTPIEDEDHPRRKPEAIAAQKEAAAKRRSRRGARETRYTDIGSDTRDSDPAYMPADQLDTMPPADPEVNKRGLAEVRRILAPHLADQIAKDSDNDPRTALALSRARAERRDQR